MWVQSLGWEHPLEEGVATHSSILPGESHRQRSLEGYSPNVAKRWTRLKWQHTRTQAHDKSTVSTKLCALWNGIWALLTKAKYTPSWVFLDHSPLALHSATLFLAIYTCQGIGNVSIPVLNIQQVIQYFGSQMTLFSLR